VASDVIAVVARFNGAINVQDIAVVGLPGMMTDIASDAPRADARGARAGRVRAAARGEGAPAGRVYLDTQETRERLQV
jgi:hypothetical protein